MKFHKKLPLTLTLLAGLSANQVHANTLIFTETVDLFAFMDFTQSDVGLFYPVDALELSAIPQFNPASGTLNSATISIGGFSNLSYDFDAFDVVDSSQPNSIDVEVMAAVDANVLIGGTNFLNPFEFYSSLFGCTAAPFDGPCFGFDGTSSSLLAENTFTGSDLTPFLGTDSLIDISVELRMGLVDLTGNNVIDPVVFADADFMGDVTITYDYALSAVPIPASVWLFGSGLIGLIGVARRKKYNDYMLINSGFFESCYYMR